jgi:hypothetical protein
MRREPTRTNDNDPLPARLAGISSRNYLSEATGKTGGANRVEAARIARERGWL